MGIKIITTEDGSHSLFDDSLNETYHSTRGAKGESEHVFIQEGLDFYVKSNRSESVQILEIGLGTGLNVLLTSTYHSSSPLEVSITSLEPYPIERDIYLDLNYGESEEEKQRLLHIHESDWEKEVHISNSLTLLKSKDKLEEFQTEAQFDIIYFDAFAPSKQAEVWSLENLQKCFQFLKERGILTTYCAQGQFKRNLVEVGFQLETLQGAMGKKEMVRARKPISTQ